jgi:DNA-binding response OmpR family regulator
MVNIKFKPTGINTAKNGFLLGSLPFLAFIGFIFFKSAKPRQILPDGQVTDVVSLGAMLFDEKNRKLIINGTTIDLTGTETRVLHIFASSPNTTIERSRLQKEIWEDKGVIVGRSLDMFISKLRKKLEPDPTISIVVIRGKGYKLEISS